MAASLRVTTARELLDRQRLDHGPAWNAAELSGRYVEITGSATLTIAAGLVADAQRRAVLAGWIGHKGSLFYPPDFAASGIDLGALPVITVSDTKGGARAADTLMRSGGFGLIVLDRIPGPELPLGMQSQLSGLAKRHRTALVRLMPAQEEIPAGGSFASLRGDSKKRRCGPDRFTCELRIVKDKRHGPGWVHQEECSGADGLC